MMKAWPTAFLFFALVGGCATAPKSNLPDTITVINSKGDPVIGATILFEEEAFTMPYFFSPEEVKARTTNRAGQARIALNRHYWDSDGCYHFEISKDGYKDADVPVIKSKYDGTIVVDLTRDWSIHRFPWSKPFTTR
jgi:hypothetical protein